MTMEEPITTDDVARYLAEGEGSRIDTATQTELDGIAALLADDRLWAEPSGDLADRVVGAVHAAVASGRDRPPIGSIAPVVALQRRHATGPIAAIVGIAAALGIGLAAGRTLRVNNPTPDAVIALGPTDLLPRATGTAKVRARQSGLEIRLDAPGLPRRDGGKFYEAWLKGEAGLVPIGTFHEGTNVTLWAGVALADFPTLTITEEEADGDQASSGRRVLVGKVAIAPAK